MNNSRIPILVAVLVVLALLAVQEVRFRRQLDALRAEQAARNSAANSAADSPSAAAAMELPEAVRQLSQARSELATAQHRLTAALNQISTLQTQVQALASQSRRSPGIPSGLLDVPPPLAQPGQGLRRSWGEEQATGPPDTDRAGDIPTAWASRQPDAGEEWLNLEYASPVQLAEVRVRETYNPGAISKIVALLPNGQEQVLWEGVTDPTEAPVDTVFPVAGNVVAKGVKVYLDTRRVPGWNEIDAVELVGRDGTRQWAAQATASSSFADPR